MTLGGRYPQGATPSPGVLTLQPELLRAAGINPRTVRQSNFADIPVTQQDRDRLGVIRNRQLGRLKWLGPILGVVSILSITLIALTISFTQEEDRTFLYTGCVPGIVGIAVAALSLGMMVEGRKTPTGDVTTACFRCMTVCQITTGLVGCVVCMSAFGLSGIWLLIDCSSADDSTDMTFSNWDMNRCRTNTKVLMTLSVFNTVLFVIVIALLLANLCCGSCCNSRAFGVKSRYEALLDLQTARMMEMQHMQNPAMVSTMPGYQPQQIGTGYQQQYQTRYQPGPQAGYQPQYQSNPHSAYPQGQQVGAAQHRGPQGHVVGNKHSQGHHQDHHGNPDLPPSYSEVMNKL